MEQRAKRNDGHVVGGVEICIVLYAYVFACLERARTAYVRI